MTSVPVPERSPFSSNELILHWGKKKMSPSLDHIIVNIVNLKDLLKSKESKFTLNLICLYLCSKDLNTGNNMKTTPINPHNKYVWCLITISMVDEHVNGTVDILFFGCIERKFL